MTAIIKRELRSYFTSIIGYVLLGGFVFFNGFYFSAVNVANLYPDYSYILNSTTIIFLIMIPLLTMRLFSEETKHKTDQLLYTAPLKLERIVIGKYLSALLFLFIAMLITALFPISLSFFGTLPTAKIITGMIGYFLMGAAFISVGMFASSLTGDQIVAAFVCFAFLFLLFSLGGLISIIPVDTTSSVVFAAALLLALCYVLFDATKNIYAAVILGAAGICAIAALAVFNPAVYDGVINKFVALFDLRANFDNFSAGILSISDIVYYVSFSLAFIYITINVIEKRRWK